MSDEQAVSGSFPIPLIPPRTRVSVDINLIDPRLMTNNERQIYANFPYLYSCLDCKFQTHGAQEMVAHQENQGLLHKIKVGLKNVVGK